MSKKHRDYSYDEPTAAQQPAEPTPEEHARDLLASMVLAAKHNSPVTPLMVAQVTHLLGHITGQPPVATLHPILDERGHPTQVTFRAADGTVMIIDSAEEALVYVRSLSVEVQAKSHWVKADKALTEAITYVEGGDISPAVRLFQDAVAEEAKLTPKQVDIPPRDPSLSPPPPAPAPEPEPEPTHA